MRTSTRRPTQTLSINDVIDIAFALLVIGLAISIPVLGTYALVDTWRTYICR
jgi:hypothetical protein